MTTTVARRKNNAITAATIERTQDISVDVLNGILRFDLHPKSLKRQWLRRHHKKTTVVKLVTTPLGLEVEQELVQRS